MMLKKELRTMYNKFRLHFYTQILSNFEGREATLTTVESFSVEAIMILGRPTVAEFAKMMNISSPNAAYRVSALQRKGYLKKVRSEEDARIYYLEPTERAKEYFRINTSYLDTVLDRAEERFSKEDYEKFAEYLHIINTELMPELDIARFKK
ncbi:DNA-binding transcriptional regulator, MarR family [Lachnospiraceae bacterium A10]|jgi:DNA-binding MarR family transcriptional regulator|nr:DNA-binding transcriptional regulator, MarR family [Lachnospiraceae bacterium A10]